jgi:hypothetical protein
MSRATSALVSPKQQSQPEIKPSDIHELKVKTQRLILKTRRGRTQLGRIEDLIAARENAINKTHEQQTEVPAVSVDHSTTIGHLQRSTSCAENALAALKEELHKVLHHDKTFIVKELEEEGKIAYCENLRLNQRLRDSKAEAAHSAHLLQVASYRASPQNAADLDSLIRATRAANSELRDKSVAYASKTQRIEIERLIIEHQKNGVAVDSTVAGGKSKHQSTCEKIKQKRAELVQEKADFEGKLAELERIVEDQRAMIVEHLRSQSAVR